MQRAQDVLEKRNLQRELKESEAKYALILRNANDMIAILNDKYQYEYVNEEVLMSMLKYSKEEIIGKSPLDLMHPDDIENGKIAMSKCLEYGECTEEHRFFKKDGSTIWVENKGKTFLNEKGERKVLINSRDITERKKVEQKLKKNEYVLKEKVKELTCLYNISKLAEQSDISLEQIFVDVLEFIPPAWQFPDETCTKIVFNGQEYKTENFIETEWKQKAEIKVKEEIVGTVEVLYIKEMPKNNEGPFLKEERNLIKAISEFLGRIIERKQVEQKLKESEEKFRTITEQAMMGIGILQDDVVVYINKKYSDIFGYSIEEVKNWHPSEFLKTVHLEDREFIKEQSRKKQLGKEGFLDYYSFRGIKKTGETIWLDSYSKTINYKGKTANFFTLIDITEKKETEQKLKDSEEKYRHLFDHSPSSIMLISLGGVIVDCNSATEKLFGYKKNEVIGKRYTQFKGFRLDQIPSFKKIFHTLLNGEIPESFDIQAFKKDGSIIWINVQSSLIKLGEDLFFNIIFPDVTKYKEIEEALRFSEETTQALLNAPNESALLLSKQGKILGMNEVSAQIIGKISKEVVGRYLPEVFPSNISREIGLQINDVIRNDKSVHFSHFYKGKKYENMIYPISNAQGEVDRLAYFSADITEQKQAEEAFINALRQMEVYGMDTSGFLGLYIIGNNGTPLLARNVSQYEFNDLLLGGFFSAIHSFANEMFGDSLQEINLGNLRTIIKRFEQFFIVIFATPSLSLKTTELVLQEVGRDFEKDFDVDEIGGQTYLYKKFEKKLDEIFIKYFDIE